MPFKSRIPVEILMICLSLVLSACAVDTNFPEFNLSANQSSLEITQGSSTEFRVSIASSSNFTDDVRIEIMGLPEGVTAEFSPNPVSSQSTVTLTASGGAIPGSSEIELRGQAITVNPPLTKTVSLTLTVLKAGTTDAEVIIPETTTIIPSSIQASLEEVNAESLRYASDSELIAGVNVGDVLVGEASSLVPFGFLRKVVEIKQGNNETIFITERASLTDAIQKGSLKAHIELKPEDVISSTNHLNELDTQAVLEPFRREFNNKILFDKDGNEATTKDQVRATGLLEIQPVLDLDIDIDCCEGVFPPLPYLDTLAFRVGLEQHAELAVTAELEAQAKKEIKLFTHRFKTFKFSIGPVPILITPILTVSLGIDGKISAVASFQTAEDAQLIAGFAYDNKEGFSNISEADFGFSETNADFTGELKATAYTAAQLDLFFYDLIGPFGKVQASLTLDGKIPRDPVWTLEGCVALFAGINSIDLLDDLKYSAKVLEKCREIGRADNTPPQVEIVNPSSGKSIDLGVETNLNALGSDAEDGTTLFCCDYKWESNREGIIGTGPGARYSFKELGEHEIKVTITDSKGVSSSDTVTITVINSAPRVDIVKPMANTVVFRNSPVSFEASSFDPNEPGGKLACEQLVWTSNLSTDDLPQAGCELELSFSSNGVRTLSLTGTDSQGKKASAELTISVVDPPANLPPVVHINSPSNLDSVFEALSLSGTATDPEGDTPLSFEWTAKLNASAPLVIGSTQSLTWTPSDSFDFSNEGSYTLQLRLNVRDSQGKLGSDFKLFSFTIVN